MTTGYAAGIRQASGEAARVIKTRKGIMKKDVYNLFRRVIHPDTGKHVSEEDRNRAAQSLEELKTLLLKEDDAPTHPYTKLEDMPGFKARQEKLRAEDERAAAAYARIKAKREAAARS
jgi:hypothetical protein